jgi:predicted tellurium resistance membrane protein TerC
MSKAIKKIQREYRETSGHEIRMAVLENAVYGFLGSIIVVFIANRIDIAVLVGYLCYYFFVGKVINRPKYVTSLGKFILFPVPTALGAFIGYKLAGYLSILLLS